MLEAIALARRLPRRPVLEAAPGPLRGALPRSAASMVDGAALLPHFAGRRSGARRRQPDVLRVHAAGDRPAARGRAARPGDPRGRPGRPPRRGQRLRRRLRRHHQHRHRSRRVPRPRPRVDRRARRPASCAPAGRSSSAIRCRRRASIDEARADRRRPVARSGATSAIRAIKPAVELVGSRHSASAASAYPALRGAQPAAQRRRACWPHSRRCAIGCRSARRRCGTGLATVELPGRFQVVPGQPTLVLDVAHNPHAVADARAEPRPDGLLPAHPRGVRRDGATRTSTAILARDGAARRRTGTSPTCRRRARRAPQQLAQTHPRPRSPRARAGRRSLTIASPLASARRGARAADPADRIVVFGSFYTVGGVLEDGLPQRAGRHAHQPIAASAAGAAVIPPHSRRVWLFPSSSAADAAAATREHQRAGGCGSAGAHAALAGD